MAEVVRIAAPLRAETIKVLRSELTKGDFHPGDRLNEKEMCARLGVSRTTLRESLRQLEAERLIELVPGQGPVVATLNRQEASEIYQVRAALEGLAVRIFASRCTPSDLVQLKQLVADMQVAGEANDIERLLDAKDSLYGVLLRGAGNVVLLEQLQALSTRITRLRYLSLGKPGRPLESVQELRLLVGAIERGETEEAARACEQHVANAAAAALEQWPR